MSFETRSISLPPPSAAHAESDRLFRAMTTMLSVLQDFVPAYPDPTPCRPTETLALVNAIAKLLARDHKLEQVAVGAQLFHDSRGLSLLVQRGSEQRHETLGESHEAR